MTANRRASRRASVLESSVCPALLVERLKVKKEWREFFTNVDYDNSGTITLMELYRFILKAVRDEDDDGKVDIQEVKDIFKGIDSDGDGNVSLDEFLGTVMLKMDDEKWASILENSMQRKEEEKMSEGEVRRIFNEIDKDESGSITRKEAMRACRRQSVMNSLGLEDVEYWLESADKNGDGSLSFEEFKFAFVGTNMIDL